MTGPGIRQVPPDTAEYARDYENGWSAGERGSEGSLERADHRDVSHAWYDGYHDAAAGREKWAWRQARLDGFDGPEAMYAARSREHYTATAVEVLTEASEHEHSFSEWLASVLVEVRNARGGWAQMEDRPGSWEAGHLLALLDGTEPEGGW